MKLCDLLNKEGVRLNVQAADKWEAIEEGVNILVENHDIQIADREEITNLVLNRERSMSTGIGKGVGIPHATCEKIPQALAVYVRLKSPIEFEAIDGEPVQHLVIMLIPKEQYQQHIKTLAGIARLMNNESARSRLCDADSPGEIMDVLHQAESVAS